MCDWESSKYEQLALLWYKVSIPERDYVWLRVIARQLPSSLLSFQSLKGIMCDWELDGINTVLGGLVSIPERDYVWLRVGGFSPCTLYGCFNPWKGLCVIESLKSQLLFLKMSPFQSLKGIMCDWENERVKAGSGFWTLGFNPWKGLCVIESERCQRVANEEPGMFQSLKGIMCDWELQIKGH